MLTLGLDNKPKLSSDAFVLLRDIIYSKCGIFYPDTKRYLLESRLLRRLDELSLKSFEDYYYYLSYDGSRELELTNLFNSIVTNETSFFRDAPQLEGFRKLVPRVLEAKAGQAKNLKIWSSACSTGEEPLTLAMMLAEEGLHLKGWNIEIIGSDISENVLRAAESGVYDKYSLRNTSEAYMKKYFTTCNGESFTVTRRVLDLVKYRKINLVNSSEARTVRGMDIIFCRNVLIYFDDNSKKKAIANLYDSLNKGGYLFIGFSESLHNITRLFRPVSIERSMVYQKA